jgi:valine dehydrogenase (NAD+)
MSVMPEPDDLAGAPSSAASAAGRMVGAAFASSKRAAGRARARVERIFDTTAEVLALAESERVPPSVAADRLAEQRIDRVVDVRRSWLPGRR